MEIVIDFTPIMEVFRLGPAEMLWVFFVNIGWIPIAFAFLWGAKELWLFVIQNAWAGTQPKVLLAIDIPKGNEQSPRAVENMFTYLAGAHGTKNLIETYWEGQFQLSFSLEIVSIEGYTQFMIKTPIVFKNLVESAVYSQYPDAEITEVNDYTEGMPRRFPDEEYDCWGAEYVQVKNPMYPIVTYEEFEHDINEGIAKYKDPMSSLMDMCSSLGRGEQFWYQIIILPIDFSWTKKGEEEISKILGEVVEKPKNIFDKIGDGILSGLGYFSEAIYSLWGDIPEASESKADEPLKMMNLKPKEKKQIEGIQEKVSKLGFATKIRMVYIAKKDVINKGKVVNGFTGYIKQFADMDLNNLKPDMDTTATSTSYFWKQSRLNTRKNNIVNNYMNRDGGAGKVMGLLNVEELASIWHFPLESSVKAPLIQKTPGRKAEPPMSLPIGEQIVSEDIFMPDYVEENRKNEVKMQVPREKKNKKDRMVVDLTIDEEEPELDKRDTPPGNLPMA